ncbi:hypothetical protein AB0O80_07575 [Rothia kristinae]|uniref:hypothetical protein n=1 Tax=Rothia kristinae TaxID=37923 RepID=UPI0034396F0C
MSSTTHAETGRTAQTGQRRDGATRVRTYSGQGHLASNILTFILCFALLCGSLVLFSYWISDPKAGPVFVLGLAAYAVTFLIPLWLLSGGTRKHSVSGRATMQDPA